MRKISNINQKKMGALLSYTAQIVHIISNLVYVPLMLRLLGKSEYGLYQLAAATISNLNLLTLGFNSAYIRYYSIFKAKDDDDGIKKLNGMFIVIFSILSAICLLAGGVIVKNARFVLGDQLTNAQIEQSKVLMTLLVISLALSFINGVFQSQINAHEKFIWLKGMDLISYILNPVIALPLLFMGIGSTGVVAATLSVTIASTFLNFSYGRIKLGIGYSFRQFDWALFKDMAGFTFYIFVNILAEQINWSLDKFLLGRMRGTDSVAVYSVGGQIVTLYRSFSGTIRGVFVPEINSLVARRRPIHEIDELFSRLGRVIYVISFLILSGFVIYGNEFILFWAGKGYDNSYWCAIIPMVPLLLAAVQGPGIDIQRAMNRHKVRSVVYCLIAFGNLLLSIYLIGLYDEIGASIGTGVALIAGQVIFMNFYYSRAIRLNIPAFWWNILKFVPASGLVIIGGYFVKHFLYKGNLFSLLLCIAIYIIIYACVFYKLGLNKEERKVFFKIKEEK